MEILRIGVLDGESAVELSEWFSAQEFLSSAEQSPDSMGTSEFVAVTVGSAGLMRAAILALIEWIRSRRVSAEVKLDKDHLIRIDSGSDPDVVLNAIQRFLDDERLR